MKPKTLILDLDETLVHVVNVKDGPDVVLEADDGNEEGPVLIPVKLRPHVREFLRSMSKIFEILIFTASSYLYARTIIDYLDPTGKWIGEILSRVHCTEIKNKFALKDLRVIKNRDLKNMVLVDNLSHSFGLHIDNGIPILEFVNDTEDVELKLLAQYLQELAKADDVREFNRSKLRLRELAELPENQLFT